jgi:hypothetical protein
MSIRKFYLVFLFSAAASATAKVSVFLKPDPKAALFKEVAADDLMLPKVVDNSALASDGWHSAKIAVSQVGFTQEKNVMKELSLKPGSKVHVRPVLNSTLIATTTGQEMVKVVKPGPWTQVTLTKPVTVYFQLPDEPEIEPIQPVEPVQPLVPVVEVPEPVPPPGKKPSPVVSEPKPEPVPVELSVTASPVPIVIEKEVSSAAVVPAPPLAAVGDFDLLESLDPVEVRKSVAPVSSALLEEIQELDPLEVREGEEQPPTSPQLPLEIKPTVTISRNFEGKLIYKKPFFRRPGVPNRNKKAIPYQLVDNKGKRIAYVRVENIKVGNLLNYLNKQVILSGPLEENAKGKEPIIQGRIIRLDLK